MTHKLHNYEGGLRQRSRGRVSSYVHTWVRDYEKMLLYAQIYSPQKPNFPKPDVTENKNFVEYTAPSS